MHSIAYPSISIQQWSCWLRSFTALPNDTLLQSSYLYVLSCGLALSNPIRDRKIESKPEQGNLQVLPHFRHMFWAERNLSVAVFWIIFLVELLFILRRSAAKKNVSNLKPLNVSPIQRCLTLICKFSPLFLDCCHYFLIIKRFAEIKSV